MKLLLYLLLFISLSSVLFISSGQEDDSNEPEMVDQELVEPNVQILITRDYFVIHVLVETSLLGLQFQPIDAEPPRRSIIDDVALLALTNNVAPTGSCIMYTYVQNPTVGAPSQCTGEIQRGDLSLSSSEMFWWETSTQRQLQIAFYTDENFINIICDIDNYGGDCSFYYEAPIPIETATLTPTLIPTETATPTPTLIPSVSCSGSNVICIPAGTYRFNSPLGQTVTPVSLNAYALDITEVSRAEFQAFLDTLSDEVRDSIYAGLMDIALLAPSDIPMTGITFEQARSYCQSRGSGWDLPLERQWEVAAGWHQLMTPIDIGTENQPNFVATISPLEYPYETTNNVNYIGSSAGINNLVSVNNATYRTGELGFYHMAGNASEWVIAETRMTRGGSVGSGTLDDMRVNRATPAPTDLSLVGFRCAYTFPQN